MQTAMIGWPELPGAAFRQRAGQALQAMFRVPKADEDIPEDLRRLLDDEDELFDNRDEPDPGLPSAAKAGWASGMALCIPSLSLLGLLYSLLK